MIIQYNGFTPFVNCAEISTLLILSVEVVFIRFFGKSNFNPISREREQAQKNHKVKPGVQERRRSFQWQTSNKITSHSMIKAYVFKDM
ncbi:hypothetical protein BHT95_15615 [Bacillus paralicheniformis]|nr:hypothetical protein BHT95_15615 [Bacillus paralicheniformis]